MDLTLPDYDRLAELEAGCARAEALARSSEDYYAACSRAEEIRTALMCGAVLAVLCFGKVMLIDNLVLGTEGVTATVALVIALTMAVTVMCAKIVGCTLPMLAKKLGFDPAVMASPFITTIVDALSLLVYFGIATALLPQLH